MLGVVAIPKRHVAQHQRNYQCGNRKGQGRQKDIAKGLAKCHQYFVVYSRWQVREVGGATLQAGTGLCGCTFRQ